MCEKRFLTNQLDSLKEAGNIGAGNAATALSVLLKKPVDMSIAQVTMRDMEDLGDTLGGEENYIAAMLIEVYGAFSGMLVLAFELESAKKLVQMVLGDEDKDLSTFDEMDYSVLCETGNILAGSYLNALGTLTQLDLNCSVPQMAMDMAVAILSYPATEFSIDHNNMMLLETHFTDSENIVKGTYMLVLNDQSFDIITDALEKLI